MRWGEGVQKGVRGYGRNNGRGERRASGVKKRGAGRDLGNERGDRAEERDRRGNEKSWGKNRRTAESVGGKE